MSDFLILILYFGPTILVFINASKRKKSILWGIGSIFFPIILPIIYLLILKSNNKTITSTTDKPTNSINLNSHPSNNTTPITVTSMGVNTYDEKSNISTDEENYREFKANVAGITYDNIDGSSRQAIAASCRQNQKLLLIREPDNQHDKNAVKIMTEKGEQLGYLDSWNAKELQASLKGTSTMYAEPEVFFSEFGTFENDRGKEMPYCEILIRRYFKQK